LPRKLDVELKGGMYTFMSLKLYTNDISTIDERIAEKVQQAPGFFKNTPIVVDLTELDTAELSLDTSVLLECIRKHKLVPIVASVVNQSGNLAAQIALPLIEGVSRRAKPAGTTDNKAETKVSTGSGSSADRMDASLDSSLDNSLDNSLDRDVSLVNDQNDVTAGAVTGTNLELDADLNPLTAQEVHYIVKQPQLMTRPVRSGQQVYARETDLIVMGQVGAGAEVIADNHIHIYGALRGRAEFFASLWKPSWFRWLETLESWNLFQKICAENLRKFGLIKKGST